MSGTFESTVQGEQREHLKKRYPISETFTSPQGEGLYAGTLMFFVRLAGCSVGRPQPERVVREGLPIYVERCRTSDGREFDCDTDFRTKELLTVEQIMSRSVLNIEHMCITGGEPLNHDLLPLVRAAFERRIMVHIETSGTVAIPAALCKLAAELHGQLWITVSPKQGVRNDVLSSANEIKFLVDEYFDLAKADGLASLCPGIIWIQPINYENEINHDNVGRCLHLLSKRPNWRLSTQMHKVWRVR